MKATLSHKENKGALGLKGNLPWWTVTGFLTAMALQSAASVMRPDGEPAAPQDASLSVAARPRSGPLAMPDRTAHTLAVAVVPPAAIRADPTARDSGPVEAVAGLDAPAAKDDYPDSDMVLFLTIIGDQTYYHWGRAGDRPPRIDILAAGDGGPPVTEPVESTADSLSAAADGSADANGGIETPYGPAPQECPRTLPPGSSQATADSLRSQSGCRYLSSCSADNQECTWYYQGRG